MADLQPDRSLVRSLLSQGLDLWLIDSGQPTRTERWLTIDDYVDDYIDAAVGRIARRPAVTRSRCSASARAACYDLLRRTASRQGQEPGPDHNANRFPCRSRRSRPQHGFLNVWTRSLDGSDVDKLVDAYGGLPGEFMSSVFSLMTPMRSLTKYNVDLIDVVDDEAKLMNFLRMEKWLADRPAHPGEAAKQWLKDLYQQNKLVKGEFELSGRHVDLSAISASVLNIFALNDHIIPPACSQALAAHVGSEDYSEIPLPGGHVGLFVSSKSQGKLSKNISEWLAARD